MTDSSNIQDDIKQILKQVQFGEVVFQVKQVDGKPLQLIAPTYNHVRYKDNIKAGTDIIGALARLAEEEFNGAYTFTANFKSGIIKDIIYEGLEQRHYGKQTKKEL